jgi:hypothetical protein
VRFAANHRAKEIKSRGRQTPEILEDELAQETQDDGEVYEDKRVQQLRSNQNRSGTAPSPVNPDKLKPNQFSSQQSLLAPQKSIQKLKDEQVTGDARANTTKSNYSVTSSPQSTRNLVKLENEEQNVQISSSKDNLKGSRTMVQN